MRDPAFMPDRAMTIQFACTADTRIFHKSKWSIRFIFINQLPGRPLL